jgi:hypothetical protein
MRRISFAIALAAMMGGALALRIAELDRYPLQVDWANYLYSAEVMTISPGESVRKIVGSDLYWVRSGNFFGKFMPHSYLHQYLMRICYRIWPASKLASCAVTALLGALSPLVLIFYLRRDGAVARVPALYAGAILAFVPFHVLYSRSGWAQVPAAFFVLIYIFESRPLLVADVSGPSLRRAVCITSLALLVACGFHETSIVSGAGTLLAIGLSGVFVWPRPGRFRALARRLAWASLAVLPAALFALVVFRRIPDHLAIEIFSAPGQYVHDLREMLTSVFGVQKLLHGFSVPVIALFAVGVVHLWRRRRLELIVLSAQLVCYAGAFVILPLQVTRALRMVMPVLILLMIGAAYGLQTLYLARSAPRALFHALATCLVCFYAYSSFTLIFVDANLRWQGLHPRQLTQASRDAAAPLRNYLATNIRPTDATGVFFIIEGIFYLKDAGIDAEWLGYDYGSIRQHTGDGTTFPQRFILTSPDRTPPGAPASFGSDFREDYELASVDRLGRCGAFVRRSDAPATALP